MKKDVSIHEISMHIQVLQLTLLMTTRWTDLVVEIRHQAFQKSTGHCKLFELRPSKFQKDGGGVFGVFAKSSALILAMVAEIFAFLMATAGQPLAHKSTTDWKSPNNSHVLMWTTQDLIYGNDNSAVFVVVAAPLGYNKNREYVHFDLLKSSFFNCTL